MALTPPVNRNANSAPAPNAAGKSTADTLPATGPLPVSALAQALANSESQPAVDPNAQVPPVETGQVPPLTPAEGEPVDELAAGNPNTEGRDPNTEPAPGEEPAIEAPREENVDGLESEPVLETPAEPADTPGVTKRIAGLQAKIRELQTQVDAALATSVAPTSVGANDQGPLAGVNTAQELAAEGQKAEAALEEIEMLLTKLSVAPGRVEEYLRAQNIALRDERGQEDYSAERVADFLTDARRRFGRVLRALPERRAELEKREAARASYAANYATAHAQVLRVMPWVEQAGDERQAMMEQIARQFPTLKSQPNWEYWVGCAVEGHLGVQKRVKPNGVVERRSNGTASTPALQHSSTPRPLPNSGGGGSARVQPRGDQAKIDAARQRVFKEGSRKALSAFFQTVAK